MRFVKLETLNGNVVFINPSRVCAVLVYASPDSPSALVDFGDCEWRVKGTPEEVARRLEGRRRGPIAPKIAAIKVLRHHYGHDLATAKRMADEVLDGEPPCG